MDGVMNKGLKSLLTKPKVKPVYKTLTMHTYRVGNKKYITRRVLSK